MNLSPGEVDKFVMCQGRCKGCAEEDSCPIQDKVEKFPYLREKYPPKEISNHICTYVRPKNPSKPLSLK
jgi:hypothetical protein